MEAREEGVAENAGVAGGAADVEGAGVAGGVGERGGDQVVLFSMLWRQLLDQSSPTGISPLQYSEVVVQNSPAKFIQCSVLQ